MPAVVVERVAVASWANTATVERAPRSRAEGRAGVADSEFPNWAIRECVADATSRRTVRWLRREGIMNYESSQIL
jgi:hypothetical protein